MKVAIVSVSIKGGAGLAALRLFRALRESGVAVDLLLAESAGVGERVIRPRSSCFHRLGHAWHRRLRAGSERRLRADRSEYEELFSDSESDYGDALADTLSAYDVVHLHWVAGFFEWKRFWRRLRPGVKVMWTLHDMNPFTTGLHYEDPERWSLPYVDRVEETSLSRSGAKRELRSLARKRAHLERASLDLTVVAPSEWLRYLAARSRVFAGFSTVMIPNTLDLKHFSPGDWSNARARWGLPPDALVILFVADLAGQRRKGFDLLAEALNGLEMAHISWISASVGRGDNPRPEDPRHHHLGSLTEAELPDAYRAADLFVLPSRLDNAPNTIIEAFACGTPVVATPVGGVPEYVRPGETGWLADDVSVLSLRNALRAALTNREERTRLGLSARRWVETTIAPEVIAAQHLAIYRGAPSSRSC